MQRPPAWSAVYNWSFPPATPSIALARNAVSDCLGATHLSDLVDDVRLLVSELVTNAIIHASGGCDVTLRLDATEIRVEVADGCRQAPTVRRPAAGEANGRGMLLVETLSDRWGVDVGTAGKTVWFELGSKPPTP